MNFEALFPDSSRLIADKAFAKLGNNEQNFSALLHFIISDKGKYAARASRVLYMLSEAYPELVLPFLATIVDHLKIDNTSVYRSFLRILSYNVPKLSEDQFGLVMDDSFNTLLNPKAEVAHKLYSIHILYEMYKIEPLIKEELKLSIEANMEYGSSGIKNIGKRILKKLN
jgi:hypothetical protein